MSQRFEHRISVTEDFFFGGGGLKASADLSLVHNSLCNIHARGVANALPRAALTEGATIRYRDRAMGVGRTRAAKHSHTSGCILQDCEKEGALLTRATY